MAYQKRKKPTQNFENEPVMLTFPQKNTCRRAKSPVVKMVSALTSASPLHPAVVLHSFDIPRTNNSPCWPDCAWRGCQFSATLRAFAPSVRPVIVGVWSCHFATHHLPFIGYCHYYWRFFGHCTLLTIPSEFLLVLNSEQNLILKFMLNLFCRPIWYISFYCNVITIIN